MEPRGPDNADIVEPPLFREAKGQMCCIRCQEPVVADKIEQHYDRKHRRHTVRMEPGELDAIIEHIRSCLMADPLTSGRSIFAGPRTEQERLLWNFFVRHDRRIRKLWDFLNSREDMGNSEPSDL